MSSVTAVVLVAVIIGALVAGMAVEHQRCARRLQSLLDAVGGPRPGDGAGPFRYADNVEAVRRLLLDAETGRTQAGALTARLEGVLEGFTDAVLLFDGAGEVTVGNAAGRRIQAARHGDALVMAVARELLSTVAAPDTQTAERRVELAGPPKRTLDLAARRLPDGDRLVVVEDITERRRLEEVRRDFVANISHELKTPIGALSLLAETMTAEDDPALTAHLSQRIHREALRVSAAIDDLLLLSRIESDGETVAERVELDAVVAESMDRVAQAAAARGIRVRASFARAGQADAEAAEGDLTVDGDRRQLVSATFNLLENAVKYSDEGSEVVVRTARSGGEVVVEVADSGIGIPAKDLERVFERFYRVDRARSRLTGGTGLGLAIVRHVVQNHGGTVRLRSREGEGSTFTLVLPARSGGRSPGPAGGAVAASTAPVPVAHSAGGEVR